MKPFLQSDRLFVTPLCPIHIGSGEDFEPTNYVVQENVLYGFDPSHASLPEHLSKQLMSLATRSDLLGIQKFFSTNHAIFTPYAKALIPVTNGIARELKAKLGTVVQRESDGNAVFNKLTIERNTYNPITQEAIIPGSSFKGAIRTALLDQINNSAFLAAGENSKSAGSVEKRLFNGDFATSPLRLMKVADLMPTRELVRQIKYAVNRKKRFVASANGDEVEPKGATTRKECILPGQYRAFSADACLHDLGDNGNAKITPDPKRSYTDWRQIAVACNRYYKPLLYLEIATLDERQFASPDWLTKIKNLLKGDLEQRLNNGDAFLIRLGRYGGAESKTLAGVAQIKIMQGKGMTPTYEHRTKTVWLAADNDKDRAQMQPFGWAIVEINPQDELPSLKAWCEQQSVTYPDMQSIRSQHREMQLQAQREKLALQVQREQESQAQLLREQEEQARQQAFAQLSMARQMTISLIQTIETTPPVKQPGSVIAKQSIALMESAISDAETSWTQEEKIDLALQIAPLLKTKNMMLGKDEKQFKMLLRQLRGEV